MKEYLDLKTINQLTKPRRHNVAEVGSSLHGSQKNFSYWLMWEDKEGRHWMYLPDNIPYTNEPIRLDKIKDTKTTELPRFCKTRVYKPSATRKVRIQNV